MNTAQALTVGGVVEIDAVKNAGVRCREGDAGPSCVDLPDEYRGVRVRLEPLDDAAPVLLFDFPVNGHGAHSGSAQDLLAESFDFVYLREKPGEDYQLLFPLDHVVLQNVLQGVQLSPAHQAGLVRIVLHQKAPGELLKAEKFGQDRGGGDGSAVRQLGVAVPAQSVVEVPLLFAQGDVAVLEGLFR